MSRQKVDRFRVERSPSSPAIHVTIDSSGLYRDTFVFSADEAAKLHADLGAVLTPTPAVASTEGEAFVDGMQNGDG